MDEKTKKPARWSYKKIFVLWLCGFGLIFLISLLAQLRPAGAQEYASNDANSLHVTASQYGATWPYFRFNEATIKCLRHDPTGRPMVIIQYKPDGPEYGLNGPALSIGGYPDPRPFIATNVDGTYKAPVPQDWISRGLKLCKRLFLEAGSSFCSSAFV
ncbi:hypothetical protein HNQ68_003160 [Pseudochrobactrum saccharolyticum]|uniref:DUF2511 domain-containing protein n=1 Tax=Pseudochrobactrum saccharolyticum TaxID=354352 RepID=A0A7W8ANV9_9HYPH|nr:hypothetical protein [Pseudochrobactrum saccharolyticum]KAB0537049.1 hypothetical protein F7P81_16615 [Pseudochrobactrum saccharolyticum]MBB5092603.1 hypothetical protein [Pseudochrobactrum saccharolyticum]